MSRQLKIDHFLAGTAWQKANRTPLKQDASFRRYWRLDLDGSTRILMEAPPPEKSVSVFARIANFLRQHKLIAPEIFAINEAAGLMLLEDFGHDTFTQILAQDLSEETHLYEMAIDSLITLHQVRLDNSLALDDYNTQALLDEAQLFIEWFFPAVRSKTATRTQVDQYNEAWRKCFSGLKPLQSVVVLRDYHVDNLMAVRRTGDSVKCGLLDFQDALFGSPAYDLVSLLEDARRDVSPTLAAHCLDRYLSGRQLSNNTPACEILSAGMNILGAQRHAKVLGIFVRLAKRDGKTHYLAHLPRVLKLFTLALEREPLLAPIALWCAKHLSLSDLTLPSEHV